MTKERVTRLLEQYEEQLRARLATPEALTDLDAAARKAASGKKNVSAENAVVGKLLVPTLFSIIEADLEHTEQARGVLHSEAVEPRKAQQASSLTCARASKHPFGKVLSESAATIAALWSAKGSTGLAPACPDFALGPPYRVVFEAKYFRSGTPRAAAIALVDGLYQAFFYRALPAAPAKYPKKQAPWDYEYACFVAVDRGGEMEAAWKAMRKEVRDSFWESANIYPIIVGPPRTR